MKQPSYNSSRKDDRVSEPTMQHLLGCITQVEPQNSWTRSQELQLRELCASMRTPAEKIHLADLSGAHLETWHQSLRSFAPDTQRTKLKALVAAFQVGVGKGWFTANPAAALRSRLKDQARLANRAQAAAPSGCTDENVEASANPAPSSPAAPEAGDRQPVRHSLAYALVVASGSLLLRPEEAVKALGRSKELVQEAVSAGWLKPAVVAHRLTLYSVEELAACAIRIGAEGRPPKRGQADPSAAEPSANAPTSSQPTDCTPARQNPCLLLPLLAGLMVLAVFWSGLQAAASDRMPLYAATSGTPRIAHTQPISIAECRDLSRKSGFKQESAPLQANCTPPPPWPKSSLTFNCRRKPNPTKTHMSTLSSPTHQTTAAPTAGQAPRSPKPPMYVAKVGSVRVYVRQFRNRGKPIFTVEAHDQKGKRHRFSRSDLGKAKTDADRLAARISQSGNAAFDTTLISPAKEAEACLQLQVPSASQSLTPEPAIAKADVHPLPAVAASGAGVMVIPAVGIPGVEPKRVPEVVAELLKDRRITCLSAEFQAQHRRSYDAFAAAFPGPIHTIRCEEIETWLEHGLDWHANTQRNVHEHLCKLFNFAQARRHVTRHERHEMWFVHKPKAIRSSRVSISPVKLAEGVVLVCRHAVDPDAMLHLALGGWGGLREVELRTLLWEDFEGALDSSTPVQIILGEEQVKLRTDERVVSVQGPLLACVAPFLGAGLRGPVFSVTDIVEKTIRLLRRHQNADAGSKDRAAVWSKNFLRKGFGTYRLGKVQSTDLVSLEMGNSPHVVKNHYAKMVPRAEAEAYWDIRPPLDYGVKVARWLENLTWAKQRDARLNWVVCARRDRKCKAAIS